MTTIEHSHESQSADETLYRLVYVSTAQEALSEQEMSDILNVSQSNNYERYITGFLAHNRDTFMQVLEGPRDEVLSLYEAIAVDKRHKGVAQIVGEPIQKRAFEAWAMNYHRVDGANGGMLVRRDEQIEDLMPSGAPRDLLWLFSKFIKIE